MACHARTPLVGLLSTNALEQVSCATSGTLRPCLHAHSGGGGSVRQPGDGAQNPTLRREQPARRAISVMGAWHEALGRRETPRPSAHLLTALLVAGLAVAASQLVSKLMRSRRRSRDAAGAPTAAAAAAATGEDEVTASARLIAGAAGSLCI